MKKICVLFPGVGYTTSKPLLYYTGKLAKSAGYEVRCVSYKDLPKNIGSDKEKMRLAYETALEQTREQLKGIDWLSYGKILFVGKSIGTAIAASFGKDVYGVKYIYLTPLAETFEVARNSSGIAFHGTGDPWADTNMIKEACRERDIPLYTFDDANHSLETDDVMKNLSIVKEVLELEQKFMRRGTKAFFASLYGDFTVITRENLDSIPVEIADVLKYWKKYAEDNLEEYQKNGGYCPVKFAGEQFRYDGVNYKVNPGFFGISPEYFEYIMVRHVEDALVDIGAEEVFCTAMVD